MFKRIKKRYIIVIAIVLLVVLVIFLKKNDDNSHVEHQVMRTDVSDELLLAGTIDVKQRVNLGFGLSGRVLKNHFEVGDLVKKGDVLAELSQNRLYSNLLQAQAQYAVTEVDANADRDTGLESYEKRLAEQNTLVEGLYQQYLSGDLQAYDMSGKSRDIIPPVISGNYTGLEEGEYILETYRSHADSGYSFHLSGLEEGKDSVEVYQPGLLGTKGLYIQFDPNTSYRDSQWLIPVPNHRSSTYLSRKTAYENALKARDAVIADAENNVKRITNVSGSNITKTEALKKQARAQVNAVYAELNDGKITAPFDGVIAKNNLELGETVGAFDSQIVLFADFKKELILNVPEIYIHKVSLKDNVDIVLDAYPDEEFTGKVSFIDFVDTRVDGVPVYQIKVELDQEDERIRVGMNAKAQIISESVSDVLAIPFHYITINGEENSVLIKTQEDSFEDRIVTLGLRGNDGLVEVVSGVNEGDIIILKQN